MRIFKPLFNSCGDDVWFDPDGSYTFSNISIGDSVRIGVGAEFIAANTTITIGNKVLFGPNVTIRGGNHNTSTIGKYMFDVSEKQRQDDQPVVIEDDVWVGSRVIILKGVTIGRGSIVAAGSVVTRSIPPYSVAAGVPAGPIKRRWSVEKIIQHEKLLYPIDRRLDEAYLKRLQDEIPVDLAG